MPEQESENRRFGRIREMGESVTDVTRAVTGQSTAYEIAEFTDAYTEVLTGLNDDIRKLQRRLAELEHASKNEAGEVQADPALSAGPDRRLLGLVAFAVLLGLVALVVSLVQ